MNIQLLINNEWTSIKALAVIFLKGNVISVTTDQGITIRTTKDKFRYE